MDYSPIVNEVLKALWWFIPVALLISLLQSPWFKGTLGEAFVKLTAKLRLPADTYRPIHNVTLSTADGTTQIDHIVVSRFGIFVVETKNMRGWIFGRENQPRWTQKFHKTSFKFQNPLRQNYRHVKALEAALDVPAGAIHSVVAFVGDSRFKTPMPANVTRKSGYIRYIKSFRDPVLSEHEVVTASPRFSLVVLSQVGKRIASMSSGLNLGLIPQPKKSVLNAVVPWSCVPQSVVATRASSFGVARRIQSVASRKISPNR